ncbi:unnamed protein product [Microthlaspi erraticum]|uniref:Retrotransposon gag domain-containing protein n=1 Tax=Microthlaspi erraticum TaxID=1685480 RepID=A0A6D2K7R2_9BRAS|nr:unnamed protein product [Microthlaspi erraticum]
MRTRSSRSTEDLVELDFTTGRKRVQSSQRVQEEPEDAIKLRLFPMSLSYKAHQWEKSLPHGTITTWDECKKAFLAKFFSTGRTAKLRSEISSFIQRKNETFAEAWEGFKGYREMLDTASNGNFLNQDVDDGWQLIESDEKLRKDVKALNEKLDKLVLAQSTMKKVNFVSAEEMEEVEEGEDTQFAEDQVYPQQQAARSSQAPQHGYGQKNNYQGPQGTFPGQQMNIPPGFPHQPTQPAPTQENELKAMLKQLLQGQADGVVDTSKKLAEINSKIENLNTRVYSLENHASSVAAATKQGQLPGKAIQNPKEQCKVIFTQEGLVEKEDEERVIEDFCLLLNNRGIRSSPFLSLILQVHRSEVVNGYRTQGPDCTLQVMSLRTS